jgi:hypothetical protein
MQLKISHSEEVGGIEQEYANLKKLNLRLEELFSDLQNAHEVG